jgi:hypothetical protein
MPDWLDVDAAQTFLLALGALLALFTYRASRRDRWNQFEERHLLNVADRIAEVGAAAEELKHGDRSGQRTRLLQAQKRLFVALQLVGPYLEQLPACEQLLEADPNDPARISDVLAPIAAGDVADVMRGLPEGPWLLPFWMQRLRYVEWRRTYWFWVREPLRRLRRRLRRRGKDGDDDDDIIVEA